MCEEQNDFSEENGYAFWPATRVGEISEGICKEGWHIEGLNDSSNSGSTAVTLDLGFIEIEVDIDRLDIPLIGTVNNNSSENNTQSFSRGCYFNSKYEPVFEPLYKIRQLKEGNPYTDGKKDIINCLEWADNLFGDDARCISPEYDLSKSEYEEKGFYMCAPEKEGNIIFSRGKCDSKYWAFKYGMFSPNAVNPYTDGKELLPCAMWADNLFGNEAQCISPYHLNFSEEVLDREGVYMCAPQKHENIIFLDGKCNDMYYPIINAESETSYRHYPIKCVKD